MDGPGSLAGGRRPARRPLRRRSRHPRCAPARRRRPAARPPGPALARALPLAALLLHLPDADAAAAGLADLRQRLHALLRPGHGSAPILALLLLWLRGGAPDQARLARLAAIYAQHGERHPWLAGPHDLPACACLVDLPGEPAAIGEQALACYHALRRDGLPAGFPTELGALLLPLTGLPAAAVARVRALRAAAAPPDAAALILLALAPAAPAAAADGAANARRRLAARRPPLQPEVVGIVAAGLLLPPPAADGAAALAACATLAMAAAASVDAGVQ